MNFKISLLYFTVLAVSSSFQVILYCKFQQDSFYSNDDDYRCEVSNLTTSYKDRNVTEIVGSHVYGKNNGNVVKISMRTQNCPFIPLNLGSHFPNLKKLLISKSNIQYLMTGDLDGLNKLEILDLSNNPIEQIGHDFFIGKSTLKVVSFTDCHLKKIDAQTFDPLVLLNSIYLKHNECIDLTLGQNSELHSMYGDFIDSGESVTGIDLLEHLKKEIIANCQHTHHTFKEDYNELNCDETDEVTSKVTSTAVLDSFLIAAMIVFTLFVGFLSFALLQVHKKLSSATWQEMRKVLA